MSIAERIGVAVSIVGGCYTIAVVIWKFSERELDKAKSEIMQTTKSDMSELRVQIESRISDIGRSNIEYVTSQVAEAHRRIDRTQAETNQLLKGVDVDMALLKYKSDMTEEHLKKMDGKIDNIQINLGTIGNTMQKLLYRAKDPEET